MSAFANLNVAGKALRLEYQWVGLPDSQHPTVVFLHEGLGSVALWKDFPEQFCRAGGLRGLVYSRDGYGRSTPRPHDERLPVDFMHRQAWEVLAARFPVSGLVVAAPHIFVEDVSIDSIAKARTAYLEGGLRERLARYHDDIDSAFWGWNDVWLDPAFRAWDIREHLPAIAAPLLAVQGEGDEYGTLEQIAGIARLAPQTRLLVLPDCGHSPHRDHPGRLIIEATRFMISPN
jgi:pimeloyl-ACP methyl ester carboxylesterase